MKISTQRHVSGLLRRVPLRHRPLARAVVYGVHLRACNARFWVTHPRTWLRVQRLTRLMRQGRTEIEA